MSYKSPKRPNTKKQPPPPAAAPPAEVSDDDDDDGNVQAPGADDNNNNRPTRYEYIRTPVKHVSKPNLKFTQQIQKSPFKPISRFNEDNAYEYVMQEVEPPSATVGRRNGKDYENVKGRLGQFGNLSLTGDSSTFKRNFLDMIINGNYRVKYIPSAAARDTAKEYCMNHLDETGVPKYRLLPTNSQDPLGNRITDLNGDKVDDIVLVDKRGIPAIVNGYKLVHASPYKKAWKTICDTKAKRQAKPFNVWLKEQFDKDITKVDWERGEYKLTKSEALTTLEKAYGESGIGKARMSKRLSPNSYWASLFSHIWNVFWGQDKLQDWLELKKLTNFLAVCNAIYIYYFDLPAKSTIEQRHNDKSFNYPSWSNWKSTHKSEYMQMVGPMFDQWIKLIDQVADRKTGALKDAEIPDEILEMLEQIEQIVFLWGFNTTFDEGTVPRTDDQGKRTPAAFENLLIYVNTSSPIAVKEVRDSFIDNINQLIDYEFYGAKSGYLEMKAKNKEARNARKAGASRFEIVYGGRQ